MGCQKQMSIFQTIHSSDPEVGPPNSEGLSSLVGGCMLFEKNLYSFTHSYLYSLNEYLLTT